MRRDLSKVQYLWMAVASVLSGAAQRDVLHQRHMVANACCLAYHNPCTALPTEARAPLGLVSMKACVPRTTSSIQWQLCN